MVVVMCGNDADDCDRGRRLVLMLAAAMNII